MVLTDIDIARQARPQPIDEIARKLDLPEDSLELFGKTKAKVSNDYLSSLEPRGKLILVTAVSPTPAGEGKTTTSVGLGDGLNALGKRVAVCLREPSLGPCFGVKGGAAGGGYAQVVPMEELNLHFTGDFHAIGAAHNMLSALLDNHIYWGNERGIDLRRISWRRVMDMNDRALRELVLSLGGVANGFPREGGFDITVASEVMAIFCLSSGLEDLTRRLGNIVVGENREKQMITASDLRAAGSMSVLLRRALQPNLVQTLEGTPVFVHGGPFANIAHGCNSVLATRGALGCADYVVTEAGFGADLGAEKFFDIKCRKAGLSPSAVVVVASVRALKYHGGVERGDLGKEDVSALERGLANLDRHLSNVAKFGVPSVVALNRFPTDKDSEIAAVESFCSRRGDGFSLCTHWAEGSKGTLDLARRVVDIVDGGGAKFKPLYEEEMGLWEKIQCIVSEIYRGSEAIADKVVRAKLSHWQSVGYGRFPVCMAKTQYSFSTDPRLRGAPDDHVVPVRDVRLCAGAEFVVAICGEIMTMPGLPSKPAANSIHIDEQGLTQGLF